MEQIELEQIIEQARHDRVLNLRGNQLTILPENIGSLTSLIELNLWDNQLTSIPESIGNLTNLTRLYISDNQLNSLPASIGNLTKLTVLGLNNNQLTSLPESIQNLSELFIIGLGNNQISSIPAGFIKLTNLAEIFLSRNPLVDLSILQKLPRLKTVNFMDTYLNRQYWIKLSDWQSIWLLNENNAAIRRLVIKQIGYERICRELNAITLDLWSEYTLLKIDGIEKFYDIDNNLIDTEPIVLLKMTCPSTAHIHILRVPPEMMSAEAAITWVNHGIHPDEFAVQT